MGAGNMLPAVTPFHELVPCQPIFKILRSPMSEIHACGVSYEFRNFMVGIERAKQWAAPEKTFKCLQNKVLRPKVGCSHLSKLIKKLHGRQSKLNSKGSMAFE